MRPPWVGRDRPPIERAPVRRCSGTLDGSGTSSAFSSGTSSRRGSACRGRIAGPARSGCASRSSGSAAPGSSSARCWRCVRPAAGRVLRRALQAPEPGRAVPLRGGPADRPPGARGRPEVVFRSFETESFAAASIGQVHRATSTPATRGGQGPAARHPRDPPGRHRADVRDAWLLDWVHLFGVARSRDVIDEFARWTADELDYMVEARQAVLLCEHRRATTTSGSPGSTATTRRRGS